MKKYTVYVDDNYHYADESERYSAGSFNSLGKAVAKCAEITVASLEHLCEAGMTPEKLSAQWSMFGDDPYVFGADSVPFSARKFVTDELCRAVIEARA